LQRLYGFGSVYGKAVRDSRLALFVVVGLVALAVIIAGYGFHSAFGANRQAVRDMLASLPPAFVGIILGGGDVTNLDTLGGYVARDAQLFYLALPIWSILALSATLAEETRRGSLEFVASAASTKRRIALHKLAAHATVMALVVAMVGLVVWLAGRAFADLPADAISPGAAAGWSIWLGLSALVAGSIAFALAPFLGRTAAAGIAGVLLATAYLGNAFAAAVPVFRSIGKLSWFSLIASFNPLAGQWSWGPLAVLAAVPLVLFAVGIEGFGRRDLAVGSRRATIGPELPHPTFGLHGPTGRSLAERLVGALAWGAGIGAYGLIFSASSRSFQQAIARTPGFAEFMQKLFPEPEVTTAGGFFHQATFMALAYPIAGLAAATLVAGWASDETSGRLEMLLTTPLAPARWLLGSSLGACLAIAAMTAVIAVGVAVGTAMVGGDLATAVVGTVVLGLYAAAMAGIGFAAGGLVSTRLAGLAVAVVVVAMFLDDFLVKGLSLPDWMHRLALSANFGQPMVGTWDIRGVVASLLLAIGGLALGAWGIRRRDLSR
jgi:ABC-2 type transport system permease protein